MRLLPSLRLRDTPSPAFYSCWKEAACIPSSDPLSPPGIHQCFTSLVTFFNIGIYSHPRPTITASFASYRCSYGVFSFSFIIPKCLLIPLETSPLTAESIGSCVLFNFHMVMNFPRFLLISNFLQLSSGEALGMISILCQLTDWLCGAACCQSRGTSHVCSRRCAWRGPWHVCDV